MRVPISFIFFSLLTFTIFSAYTPVKRKEQRVVSIIFDHRIGNQVLQIGEPAINIFGETVTIERFRYYISNFSVTDRQGNTTILPVQYFLVDETDSLSKKIKMLVPVQPIASIHFLLGVDSLRNVSGIQTGALDPAKGMFWTWNSGYVMAKLEGSSGVSKSPGNRFTYHVGGFRTGMNTAKIIDLTLLDTTKQSLQKIHITADINSWFKGSTDLHIAETPVCHSPGTLAVRIADNYSSQFSINLFTK